MFFRSSKAILLAIILMVVGGAQFLMGLSYEEASKREATTVGTLVRAEHGRTSTYEYQFKMNGVSIRDSSDTCRTALSPAGCKVGAPVLVYYDPEQVAGTQLQEYGVAGRGKIFFGVWMMISGLFVIGLYFLLNRVTTDQSTSEATDEDQRGNESEAIHITPVE